MQTDPNRPDPTSNQDARMPTSLIIHKICQTREGNVIGSRNVVHRLCLVQRFLTTFFYKQLKQEPASNRGKQTHSRPKIGLYVVLYPFNPALSLSEETKNEEKLADMKLNMIRANSLIMKVITGSDIVVGFNFLRLTSENTDKLRNGQNRVQGTGHLLAGNRAGGHGDGS